MYTYYIYITYINHSEIGGVFFVATKGEKPPEKPPEKPGSYHLLAVASSCGTDHCGHGGLHRHGRVVYC